MILYCYSNLHSEHGRWVLSTLLLISYDMFRYDNIFSPNDNGIARSRLNIIYNMKDGLIFHAIYGWLDIDTSSFHGTYDDIDAIMYCGYWYQYSCEL